MEAFRGKPGPADLEVTISCLDPGPFASRSLPALHSLPALKLLGPAVNLGTIKPSKGLVLRTISWGFCNKGASCPGRCETSRQADGTLLKGPFGGGGGGWSDRVHTWDGLRCHLAWRGVGSCQLQCRSLSLQGSRTTTTLSFPGRPLQVSMHLAMNASGWTMFSTQAS